MHYAFDNTWLPLEGLSEKKFDGCWQILKVVILRKEDAPKVTTSKVIEEKMKVRDMLHVRYSKGHSPVPT